MWEERSSTINSRGFLPVVLRLTSPHSISPHDRFGLPVTANLLIITSARLVVILTLQKKVVITLLPCTILSVRSVRSGRKTKKPESWRRTHFLHAQEIIHPLTQIFWAI